MLVFGEGKNLGQPTVALGTAPNHWTGIVGSGLPEMIPLLDDI